MTLFPPQFHGKAFTVLYSNEPLAKTPTKAHLITSPNAFELISADWTTAFQRFEPADIAAIDNRKTSVVLTMRAGSKVSSVTLSTAPFPCDTLATALTAVSQIPRPEISFRAVSEVLPSFHFKDIPESLAVHKAFMKAAGNLVLLFRPLNAAVSDGPPAPLVDALTCLFRMRYRNSNVEKADRSVPDTILAVKRRMLVLWCRGIQKCAAVSTNANENVFHSRMAVHAAGTVVKLCQDIGVESRGIGEIADKFVETGTPEGLEAAAKAIEGSAQEALDAELAARKTCDDGHVAFVMHEVIVLLAGVVVGLYMADLVAFGSKILALTKAAVHSDDTAERKELAVAHDEFMGDMLVYLDGIRFEEKFQYPFCLSGPAPTDVGKAQFE
jgi:hypothetical protein